MKPRDERISRLPPRLVALDRRGPSWLRHVPYLKPQALRHDEAIGPTGRSLPAAITLTASRQTYWTIRVLVDRLRVDDAYRAYAYFRWVDDVLDAGLDPGSRPSDAAHAERQCFLARQERLLDRCLRGDPPRDASPHEAMLVDLLRDGEQTDFGLRTYVSCLMQVMAFDVGRRGRTVCQAELDRYTSWLAIAVTEAMHYFIGHEAPAPPHGARYLAASGCHILHMLRDTHADVRAGYFNVPRELLSGHALGPGDVQAAAYRSWIEARVGLARDQLNAGREYFAGVRSGRLRLAGLAYIARFEWLIQTLEKESFQLRDEYPERRRVQTGIRMSWSVMASMVRAGGDMAAEPVSADVGQG